MTALLVILMVIALVAIDATRLYLKRHRAPVGIEGCQVLAFAQANPPRGLFLDKSHTWVRVADSGEVRVGIDELLAQATGGADSVKLPDLGKKVRRGEPLATLRWRDGRSMAVPSPIDGTVITSNDALESSPGELTADPYGSGWLSALWPADHAAALKPLVVGEASKRWMDREIQRFSDFLAVRSTAVPGLAMAADGAHPAVGSARVLGDEAWQDFQREFSAVVEN